MKDKKQELLQSVFLPIEKLENNTGQLEGIPANPRKITDADVKQLRKSIEETPEMLNARELLVVPNGDTWVAIGGNQRLRALRALGYEQAVCKIIPENYDRLAIAIKDNTEAGEWDYGMLEQDWDKEKLADWGVNIGGSKEENPYAQGVNHPIYEIKGDKPTIAECINLDEVKAKIAAIDVAEIPEETKEMLRAAAYRLADINFKNMAEFYAHADAETQRLMEEQCLVIVDFEKAIENGWVKMDAKFRKLYEKL